MAPTSHSARPMPSTARKLNGKLPELRIFIDSVRRRTGVPYPLAHARPFVGESRALILEAQDEADLPADLRLIAEVRGQRVLLPAADLSPGQVG